MPRQYLGPKKSKPAKKNASTKITRSSPTKKRSAPIVPISAPPPEEPSPEEILRVRKWECKQKNGHVGPYTIVAGENDDWPRELQCSYCGMCYTVTPHQHG